MRYLKTIILCSCLLAALAVAAAAQTKSLYERLGGKEAITAVVDEFAGRCLADQRINQKFAKSDPVRLKTQLVEQICAATGGPCKYTGRDMKSTHLNMGVTEGEFNALVEDLVGALDKFKVPEAEKNELLGLLAPMKSDMVEINSSATGTPLPKAFKPFKAKGAGKAKKKDKAAAGAEAGAAGAAEAPAESGKGKKKKAKAAESEAGAAAGAATEAPAEGGKAKKKAKAKGAESETGAAATGGEQKATESKKSKKQEKPN